MRFLREFRRRHSTSLKTSVADVSEKYSKQYPNLSRSVVREVAKRALEGSFEEADLVEALHRRSYAHVLQKYRRAELWGVLIMSQRDGTVCSACRELDGVAYGINRAADQQPLPHSDCKNQACRAGICRSTVKRINTKMCPSEADARPHASTLPASAKTGPFDPQRSAVTV